MALTPLDIHNKEFTRGFRGYDEDEVNDFLDHVIKDYEKVIREKKALEDKLYEMEEKLSHFTNIEETLNRSILVAQESADEVKSNANKEAKLIIKEAEKMPIESLMMHWQNQEVQPWKWKNLKNKQKYFVLA